MKKLESARLGFVRHVSITALLAAIPTLGQAQACVGGGNARVATFSVAPSLMVSDGANAFGAGLRINSESAFVGIGFFKPTDVSNGTDPLIDLRVGLGLSDVASTLQTCLTGRVLTVSTGDGYSSARATALRASFAIGSEVGSDGETSFIPFASFGVQSASVSANVGGYGGSASETSVVLGFGAGLLISPLIGLGIEVSTPVETGATATFELSLRLYFGR